MALLNPVGIECMMSDCHQPARHGLDSVLIGSKASDFIDQHDRPVYRTITCSAGGAVCQRHYHQALASLGLVRNDDHRTLFIVGSPQYAQFIHDHQLLAHAMHLIEARTLTAGAYVYAVPYAAHNLTDFETGKFRTYHMFPLYRHCNIALRPKGQPNEAAAARNEVRGQDPDTQAQPHSGRVLDDVKTDYDLAGILDEDNLTKRPQTVGQARWTVMEVAWLVHLTGAKWDSIQGVDAFFKDEKIHVMLGNVRCRSQQFMFPQRSVTSAVSKFRDIWKHGEKHSHCRGWKDGDRDAVTLVNAIKTARKRISGNAARVHPVTSTAEEEMAVLGSAVRRRRRRRRGRRGPTQETTTSNDPPSDPLNVAVSHSSAHHKRRMTRWDQMMTITTSGQQTMRHGLDMIRTQLVALQTDEQVLAECIRLDLRSQSASISRDDDSLLHSSNPQCSFHKFS